MVPRQTCHNNSRCDDAIIWGKKKLHRKIKQTSKITPNFRKITVDSVTQIVMIANSIRRKLVKHFFFRNKSEGNYFTPVTTERDYGASGTKDNDEHSM